MASVWSRRLRLPRASAGAIVELGGGFYSCGAEFIVIGVVGYLVALLAVIVGVGEFFGIYVGGVLVFIGGGSGHGVTGGRGVDGFLRLRRCRSRTWRWILLVVVPSL